jgi:hypothetical protein
VLRKMRLEVRLGEWEKAVGSLELAESRDQLERSREKDEMYYLCAYAHYKSSSTGPR